MNVAPEKTAVFRLEFGPGVGLGHLARCSALAVALREWGWSCLLWTDSSPAEVPSDMIQPFATVVPASNPLPPCRWLVVDDYAFNDQMFAELRAGISSSGKPLLLVIDDEGNRRLRAADLVLNTRLGLEKSPYAEGVRTLLGERYALLRPGLMHPEPVSLPFPADVEPVLVTLGGADPMGLTTVVLDVLAAIDPVRFAPVVIRPASLAGRRDLRTALDRFPAGVWLEAQSAGAFAGWARKCRWAISGAGGTVFELAVLGVPFVAVIAADNQRLFAWEVNCRWKVPVVEGADDARSGIEAAFRSLVEGTVNVAFSGIDGKGASRVAKRMIRFAAG